MKFSKTLIVVGVVVVLALILGGSCAHTYNKLVGLNEDVKAQWAKVESAYQERADKIPNLVNIVKGAAKNEKDILTSVMEARANATKITLSADDLKDPEKLKAFEAAQNQLGAQLGKLIAVAEAYPEIKSTQGFIDLMVSVDQQENRIKVERDRYNDTARAFNAVRDSFPTNLQAGFFSKFGAKAYFSAKPGTDVAPTVQF